MVAEDANRTLWTTGGGPVIGWLDTKLFEKTGDEEKAQGWTALILDTNGDGKRGEYTEPNQPIDPTKDHRINAGFYAVAPAPDGSIWGSSLGFPGGILGLGKNTPINTGNASEALLALKDAQWVILRVPYPSGFYTKWMDGRIDDASAGWKGRGLWATVSTRAPFHMETGRGTTSKVIHFQMRPDPLAK